MPIKLLPHAKQRMRERGIGKSIVIQTVMNPDSVDIDEFGGRIFSKQFGGETLRVPVYEKGRDIIVKTLFFKRRKY